MGRRIEVELLPAKYPWEEWMDGKAWEIKQGEDFADTLPVSNFVNAMHAKARKRGMKLRTKTDGPIIQFQYYTPEEN